MRSGVHVRTKADNRDDGSDAADRMCLNSETDCADDYAQQNEYNTRHDRFWLQSHTIVTDDIGEMDGCTHRVERSSATTASIKAYTLGIYESCLTWHNHRSSPSGATILRWKYKT